MFLKTPGGPSFKVNGTPLESTDDVMITVIVPEPVAAGSVTDSSTGIVENPPPCTPPSVGRYSGNDHAGAMAIAS